MQKYLNKMAAWIGNATKPSSQLPEQHRPLRG